MKTVGQTIRQSLELAKILDHSEPVDGEMFEKARQTLVDMLHDWQTEFGIDWVERDSWITLTPGRATYRFGPGGDFPHIVTDIISHTIGDGYSDVNINKLSRQEYRDRPNKSATGRPVDFMSAEQANSREVYFWPVPDRDYTFAFSYRGLLEIPEDPDGLIGTPISFDRCIRYNLAMDLMAEYGLSDPKVDGIALELKRKQFANTQESGTVKFVVGRG